jgi:hypothetical protein
VLATYGLVLREYQNAFDAPEFEGRAVVAELIGDLIEELI